MRRFGKAAAGAAVILSGALTGHVPGVSFLLGMNRFTHSIVSALTAPPTGPALPVNPEVTHA